MKKWWPWICLGLTLGWMALIFGFSAQTGETSGSASALIAEPLTRLIARITEPVTQEERAALYRMIDNVVRKTAHFAEYAVLGGLLAMLGSFIHFHGVWLPWLLGTLYACTDEWHQAYSPGRACAPMDVLIDACGVLAGILIFKAIAYFIWRKNHVYYQ